MFSAIGVVLYTSIKPRYESATLADILAFGCFFAGAAMCMGMSAMYHTISNHSPIVAKFGNKLDYVGIVFLITGSFIPSIYYGFYCHPHSQEFYWTMVCHLILVLSSKSVHCYTHASRYVLLAWDALQFLFSSAFEHLLGDHTELECSS